MKKFKTAVVGTGFIGSAHIETLRRLGNVDVVAICDTNNVEGRGKELFINKTYNDYKLMIKENELDFIHVCTPNNTHYAIAKYAMENDINVLLEKPMSFNVDEAKELYELSKTKDLICAVNFHNRLYPACAHIRKMIARGEIGDVISISGSYLQDWLLYDTDYSWRLNSNESGNTRAVSDIGSHWMDLVEYMTGLKITEVFANFSTVYPQRKKAKGVIQSFSNVEVSDYDLVDIDTEDIATILMKFENGVLGNAIFSQVTAGKKNNLDVIISGKKASIEWKLETESQITVGYRNKPTQIIEKDQILMEQVSSLIDYPAGHTEGFPDAFKQVFKQVYNQTEEKYYATFYEGLRQMEINDKIFLSAKTNKWVKIDEVE